MEIKLLCNAGLAITYEGKTLLVDIPNRHFRPLRPCLRFSGK